MGAEMGSVVLFSDICRLGSRERFLPLGVIAIGSALAASGFRVTVVDPQVDYAWRDTLRVAVHRATLLGISSLTGPSIYSALAAIRISRQTDPEVPVVWGGYHASLAYHSVLHEGAADYVVRGPGHEVAVDLAKALAARGPGGGCDTVVGMPGIAYRDGDQVRCSPMRGLTRGAPLPTLDYGLVNVRRYFRPGARVLHYVTSYGCPHACTFCAEPAHSGRRFRAAPAQQTTEGIMELKERYGPDLLSLVDPNFSSNPRRVIDIVEGLERRGCSVPMMCDMRAKDVLLIASGMRLERLAGVGLSTIYVGVESGSDAMLTRLRKGSTAEDAYAACSLLADAGIHTLTSFIHDLPGEDSADVAATLALARRLSKLPGNRQSHHFYTPYPMTALHDGLTGRRRDITRVRQVEWAQTSTYWASSIWSGNHERRASVLRRLHELATDRPEAIDTAKLPRLR